MTPSVWRVLGPFLITTANRHGHEVIFSAPRPQPQRISLHICDQPAAVGITPYQFMSVHLIVQGCGLDVLTSNKLLQILIRGLSRGFYAGG